MRPDGTSCSCPHPQMIDLASNKITEVPMELGNLTVKKLQTVVLKGNPLRDARIRRFVEVGPDGRPLYLKLARLCPANQPRLARVTG